jgi:hypothetical protein
MIDRASATETSRDLFGDVPSKRDGSPVVPRQVPSELTSARALCAQLRHKHALPDKQRIAHLICLNLISMLRQGARRRTPLPDPRLDR